jgi:AcrR family transcriptional regulator
MARTRPADSPGSVTAGIARIAPTQKRSRERFDAILACAEELLVEKGGDGFRMSDIVERTGIPFGSLYQYFPDKTAVIGTLAERCNAVGRECVRKELEAMRGPGDLHDALCRITDGYFRMYRREPVMAALWDATRADVRLQAIDREDCEHLAGLLADALRPFHEGKADELERFARLVLVLIGAAVRHAITLDDREARRTLARFKAMLPDRIPPP